MAGRPVRPKLPVKPTVARFKRMDLKLPQDLIHRMRLVRQLTGIPVLEWIRAQLTIATDMELVKRPGAFFARPGSRVYRLDWSGPDDPIPIHIATTEGGERVWVIEILADYPIGADDDGLDMRMRNGAILCDLQPEEGARGLSHRHVAIAAADCLPRANPYTTGLGAKLEKRRRETQRRNQGYRKAMRELRHRGGDPS